MVSKPQCKVSSKPPAHPFLLGLPNPALHRPALATAHGTVCNNNNNSSANSKKCKTVALGFLWQHSSEPQHNQTTAQLPHGLSFSTHWFGLQGAADRRNWELFCSAIAITSVCDHSWAHELSVMSRKGEVRETSWIQTHSVFPATEIFHFPYILSVAHLLPSAAYYTPLIQSTASKLLCGFCYTSGILQINRCTGFVLKKHLFVFKSYTWLNEKDPALCFLPGWLASSDGLLLYLWRGWRRQGIG